MPLPRFRLRTLMIAVVAVGGLLAAAINLRRSNTPAVLAAAGNADPADGTGWLRTGLPGMVIVTTRQRDPRIWGHQVQLRDLEPLDGEAAADVLGDLAPLAREDARKPAIDLGHRLGGRIHVRLTGE